MCRRAVSPGSILKQELDARGWTQKQLAQLMDRPEQAISEIITGKKQITCKTAMQLADVLGTSADLWVHLEASFRLAIEEARSG